MISEKSLALKKSNVNCDASLTMENLKKPLVHNIVKLGIT
jgi:hypothetical protein